MWLLFGFCGALIVAGLLTRSTKPSYQSAMQLLIEPNYQGKRDDQGQADRSFADTNVEVDNATQLTLMRSSQLLQRAVNQLRPQYSDLDIKQLQTSLVLTQVEDNKVKTKVFQATYTDTDPQKSQNVLKAIQKVYQDYNREQQRLRLVKGLSFIDEQLPTVRRQVNQAETKLEQFRKRENLVSPELQSKAIVEGLASVQDERQKNRAQLRDTQARYTALQQQLARSPNSALLSTRLSQSPRYQSLLSEIQKTELAIEQRRIRYTDDSFLTKPLLEQRQRQQALLQQEVGRVLGRTPAQLNGSRLLQAGQLGTTDQALANQLVEAQVSLRALQAREQSLAQTERSFTAQLRRFPSLLAQFGRLQPDAEINRETLEQLLKARQELALEIARGGFDWQVVEEPKLGTQIGPSLKRNLLLGAVAGLMLGTVAAFVRDAIDDAVHTSDDLKKQVALPLLGMVPELSQAELNSPLLLFRKPTLAATTERVVQWQSFREAMDLIYQSLQLLHPDFPPRSLVITSALAGEGKSTLALGLAMSAARLHQRVLLIDADLRRPSLHKQLNLPNDRGLSTLLTSDADPNEMQPTASYHNISVLTSGPPPADPAKLLSSRRMGELLAAFEKNYDLVLLDAPPVLGIVDTIVTASFCSGVVLVGRIDHVTRSQLTQATTMLNKLNVIGVIANGASRANSSYVAYEKRSNALFQSS